MSKHFSKLLTVCLKMLFRKTTRKRFLFLVAAFLFMMAFNNYSYVMRFHKTEIQKKEILDEKAFKVFFLRSRSRNDNARFFARHEKNLLDYGSEIINEAFIYQNNLFIQFYPPFSNNLDDKKGPNLLYDLFKMRKAIETFIRDDGSDDHYIKVSNNYFDYNGAWLRDDLIVSRHDSLRRDLVDIADMIMEGTRGKRLDLFNNLKNKIFRNIKRIPPDKTHALNPYLSRVESIVPMNYFYILTNIRQDNATDIFDLAESVIHGVDDTIKTDKSLLAVPASYSGRPQYTDKDIYPRYIPFYCQEMLKPKLNWLLYQDIAVEKRLMDYIDQLHFDGHYMFSYEKSHIIREKVNKINDDIRSNHLYFYLSDLSIGVVFPFMISLFAFIHLKAEIAFLLMFKNRIKELLFIFWLLPVFLMLIVKGAILAAYLFYLQWSGMEISAYLFLPLIITFLIASAAFYPINRWCFSQFTGDNLNLYALHKGR